VVIFQAGCDVIVIYPPKGAARNFLSADSEKVTPILYQCCFVTTRLLCTVFDLINFILAGNDVIAISLLRDASDNFLLRILKGRPQLYIHVQLTLFVHLERFRRYSTFFYLAGISQLGAKLWGVLGKMTPKRSN